MGRIVVGIEPVQVAWYNEKRKKLEIQFIPAGTIATNTGKIYLKRGSAPVASDNSNTWDAILTAGSTDGENLDETHVEADYKGDVWCISDTAGQVLNVNEINIKEVKAPDTQNG